MPKFGQTLTTSRAKVSVAPVPFAFTEPQELPRLFQSGSSYAMTVRVGHDGDKRYSIVIGLEPLPGGDMEYYFHLLEVDVVTGEDRIFWSGLPVSNIIPKDDRRRILAVILSCTKHLLIATYPSVVFRFAHDENPPERALEKHYSVNDVFEECGYRVEELDSRHGRRAWKAERR